MRRRGLATHKYSKRLSFLAMMEDAGEVVGGEKMLLVLMMREILWPSLEEGGCWLAREWRGEEVSLLI